MAERMIIERPILQGAAELEERARLIAEEIGLKNSYTTLRFGDTPKVPILFSRLRRLGFLREHIDELAELAQNGVGREDVVIDDLGLLPAKFPSYSTRVDPRTKGKNMPTVFAAQPLEGHSPETSTLPPALTGRIFVLAYKYFGTNFKNPLNSEFFALFRGVVNSVPLIRLGYNSLSPSAKEMSEILSDVQGGGQLPKLELGPLSVRIAEIDEEEIRNYGSVRG